MDEWLNKPYIQMTTEELDTAFSIWMFRVEEAAGWPSAYFAAKQLRAICAELTMRGKKVVNPYPIKHS